MRTRHAAPGLAALGLTLLTAACGGSGGGTSPAPRPPPTVVHVHDAVTATSTWTSDHLYVVDALIQVASTLTIEPGTVVKFGAPANGLQVTTGAIVADGGSDATAIVFTSGKDDAYGDTNGDGATTLPAPGDWRGVSVARSGSVFDHCRFSYGGGVAATPTLSVTGGSAVRITSCTFAHGAGGTPADSRGAAVHVAGAGVGTVLTGNTFHHDDLPLVIGGAFDVDASNLFHDPAPGATVTNRYQGIFWDAGYETTGHVAWSNTDAPYVILSPLSVPAGASLTLADGVIVKLAQGERIEVAGALVARGGLGNVVFTSIKADYRGDSNGDGDASHPMPGDWHGIDVTADGSVFDRCAFSYGGSGRPYAGTLAVRNGAAATITNGFFAMNAGGRPTDPRAAAVNVGSAGAATVLTGNRFAWNDLPLVINGLVSVDGSNVFHVTDALGSYGNTYDGIFMDGVSHEVHGDVAWSNTEVPYVIPNGTVLGIGGATAPDAGHLTLASGVVVKVGGGRIDLYETGTLTHAGAAFTSLRDDTRLGDTAGDGPTSGAKGDWAGVNVCQPTCGYASWADIYFAANPP